MDSTMSPLMRLPKGIRTRIFTYALTSTYIRYHKRNMPRAVTKKGTYATAELDWIAHYRAHLPPFRVYDPRAGHTDDSFRWLSSVMSLSLVSRQVREEARLLIWEVNVFHVSLETLPRFVKVLPVEVIDCLRHIGILNNAHLMENLENFSALKRLPALTGITLVKMGGMKSDRNFEWAMRAINEFAGKDYDMVGI